mgnify:CR=1 FL=1
MPVKPKPADDSLPEAFGADPESTTAPQPVPVKPAYYVPPKKTDNTPAVIIIALILLLLCCCVTLVCVLLVALLNGSLIQIELLIPKFSI